MKIISDKCNSCVHASYCKYFDKVSNIESSTILLTTLTDDYPISLHVECSKYENIKSKYNNFSNELTYSIQSISNVANNTDTYYNACTSYGGDSSHATNNSFLPSRVTDDTLYEFHDRKFIYKDIHNNKYIKIFNFDLNTNMEYSIMYCQYDYNKYVDRLKDPEYSKTVLLACPPLKIHYDGRLHEKQIVLFDNKSWIACHYDIEKRELYLALDHIHTMMKPPLSTITKYGDINLTYMVHSYEHYMTDESKNFMLSMNMRGIESKIFVPDESMIYKFSLFVTNTMNMSCLDKTTGEETCWWLNENPIENIGRVATRYGVRKISVKVYAGFRPFCKIPIPDTEGMIIFREKR